MAQKKKKFIVSMKFYNYKKLVWNHKKKEEESIPNNPWDIKL